MSGPALVAGSLPFRDTRAIIEPKVARDGRHSG